MNYFSFVGFHFPFILYIDSQAIYYNFIQANDRDSIKEFSTIQENWALLIILLKQHDQSKLLNDNIVNTSFGDK